MVPTSLAWLSFGLVLVSAILHAVWNVASKRHISDELLASVSLVSVLTGVLGFFTFPQILPDAYPYLFAGSVCHVVSRFSTYYLYRTSKVAELYPIVRGLIPVCVTVISLIFMGAQLYASEALLMLSILAGTALITAGRLSRSTHNQQTPFLSFGPAVLVGLAISSSAGYVVIDAQGAIISGSFYGFLSLIFFIDGSVSLLILAFITRTKLDWRMMRTKIHIFSAISAIQLASFGTFALATSSQLGSIGVLAVLREISIPITVLLCRWFLSERLSTWATLGVSIVFVSVMLFKA